ncbi:MAG: glycosyltransferase family 4 protein [Candidatus Kapabacteria bacterium]|nr:MAG: glycosyltransferase [Chlorobi bacterium OLB7]MBX7216182.1 glycosyltransferase family 4 protein [Candidatus Kapabacteria bacterium]
MSQPLVLHITNAPTPYRLPQYRAFQKELLKEGVRLHIHFLGGRSRQREWKFSDEDFAELSWSAGTADAMLQGGEHQLQQLRPAVVVLAWAMDAIALRLMLHCLRRKIPVIIYSGETHTSARRSYQWLRDLFRIPFYKLGQGFIAYGNDARQYFLDKGVPSQRVDVAINVVDTQFFVSRVDALRRGGQADQWRDRFRTESGEPFAVHLLFVGYLLGWKGIVEMAEALAALNRPDVALHVVGSGEDEAKLRQAIERNGLGGQVLMHGYQQKADLPIYYAMSDALLFPSLTEVFGLVMVEAAAAGLPIIATRFAGATADVVIDGVTGIIVDPNNIPEFSAALGRIVDSPQLRQRMGNAARQHAETELTPERSAEGYSAAVMKILQRRKTSD